MLTEPRYHLNRRQAADLYQNALTHCEAKEWDAALLLLDQAIHLDRRREYVERKVTVLDRLGRSAEAAEAREAAGKIADDAMQLHLESVFELRPEVSEFIARMRTSALSEPRLIKLAGGGDKDEAMLSDARPRGNGLKLSGFGPLPRDFVQQAVGVWPDQSPHRTTTTPQPLRPASEGRGRPSRHRSPVARLWHAVAGAIRRVRSRFP
jgi:hypothetical protein